MTLFTGSWSLSLGAVALGYTCFMYCLLAFYSLVAFSTAVLNGTLMMAAFTFYPFFMLCVVKGNG